MVDETISEIIEYEPGEEFLKLMKEEPERSHTYLHLTWAKILSGVETAWTLEDIYRLHKVVVGILRSEDLKHIANIDTLDTTETLSQVVTLAFENSPKGTFSDLMSKGVEKAHSYLHKVWGQILAGQYVNWTLEEIYRYHKMLLGDMRSNGIKHVSNVDTLDTTETLASIKEAFGFDDPNISVRKILKHVIGHKIKDPIAYLVEDQSSDKVNVLINVPENKKIIDIIKSKICEIMPRKCGSKLVFTHERKQGVDIIPILGMNEDLKNQIFKSIMKQDLSEHDDKKKGKKIWENLSDNQKNERIYRMSLSKKPVYSRGDIAKEVGMSKSTVYLRQQEMGLQ